MRSTAGMGAVSYRLRRLVRMRWRTLAVLTLVVAALGGVVLALAAGAARTLSAPDRYSDARGDVWDASIAQSGEAPPRTDELRALPAVARVEMLTFVFGGLTHPGVPIEEDHVDALVFAGEHDAFGTTLVAGRDPAATDEFVANRAFVESNGARLGDRFELHTITREAAERSGFDAPEADGPSIPATLVGVVDAPSSLEDPTAMVAFPASVLDLGDMGVSESNGSVALKPGATLADLRTQLDGLPDGGAFTLDEAQWVPQPVRDAVSAQGQGLAIVTAIAAVATIVVVGQLLSRQVRVDRAERLVLRTIGMTERQVVADQLVAAAVPVIAGTGLAAVAAWLASDIFPYGFVARVEPHPGLRFDPLVHVALALALAVLVLAWVLAALVVAGRSRVRAAGPGVVDAVATRVPPQPATGVRFAFTRHARDAVGPIGPVVAMVAVLTVLVGALTFGASLRHLVDRPSYWGANYDRQIGQGGGEVPEDVLAYLQADPDVTAFSLAGSIRASVGTHPLYVTAMEPARGSLVPVVLRGRLPSGPDEAAIGSIEASDLGLGVGDDVTLTSDEGTERTLRITGIAVVPNPQGADGVGQDVVLSSIDALRAVGPSAEATVVFVRLRPGVDGDAWTAALAEAAGVQSERPDPPAVIVNASRVRSIPYLVAATLGALAVLSLFHQLVLSTQRRRRDLAVLRALGADGRWATGVVHWQASAFTALVLLVGTPLGVVAGRLVYHAYVDRIGARPTASVPLLAFVLVVVALLALANAVAVPTARRARRRSPAATLAAE
jgi:ABC-type lipoprotein release transport system permease subunit